MADIQIPDWAKKVIDSKYPDYDHSSAAVFGACIIIECLRNTKKRDIAANHINWFGLSFIQYNRGRESIRKEVENGHD